MLDIEGMIVRGAIDLMAELADGRRLVVDYKTNRLDGRSPKQAFEPYRLQRAVYALTAADAEQRQVETAYAFLDSTAEPLRQAFGDAELAEARSELAELIAGIRAGRFEVTDRPHRRLCQDCPARERLCSYEPALTMREAPP
jgi:RecB family exonuclease